MNWFRKWWRSTPEVAPPQPPAVIHPSIHLELDGENVVVHADWPEGMNTLADIEPFARKFASVLILLQQGKLLPLIQRGIVLRGQKEERGKVGNVILYFLNKGMGIGDTPAIPPGRFFPQE